jgi:hypothetical protein
MFVEGEMGMNKWFTNTETMLSEKKLTELIQVEWTKETKEWVKQREKWLKGREKS